ncbi:MAG: hypothetical protein L0H13_06200, partial [Staphylococcus equorum]|nr:hypothetical protein [Staphylococcus equorum]
ITQLIINGVLMILSSFSSIFTQLFPFLINQARSRVLVLSVLAIGILLSGIILYRLHQIKNNEDRHYHRIKQYEEVTHA